MNTLVSIIVPVYNAEKHIRKCLFSIINQTYINIEVIVVNDGSKDRTLSILSEIATADSRVRIIDCVNGGVAKARNIGLDEANGKFLVFVDSDDYLEPHAIEYFIEKRTQLCEKNALIVSGYVQESTDGSVIQENIGNKLYLGFIWGKLFDVEVIKKYNLRFNENLTLGEDSLFVTTFATLIDQYGYVEDILYHYVQNKKSLSSKYCSTLELSERLNTEAMRNFRQKFPDYPFFKNANSEAESGPVVNALKIAYNNCCTDSPLTRKERIHFLKSCLENEAFKKSLDAALKSRNRQLKMFAFFMKYRMTYAIDFIFRVVKKSK